MSMSITSINIPNSVTSIGRYAFYGCSGLTSINIPNSVTSIEESAFRSCKGLTSITIPNNVTSIGNGVFAFCSGLTSITYKGTTYTNKTQLTSALTSNGVSVGDYLFGNTKLQ